MQLHLTRYGAKIRVKNNTFEVRYVDDHERIQKELLSPHQVKSIWLYYPTSLSVAVLELAMEHDVDIVFVGQKGMPLGRFRPHRPHTTSKVQKAQAAACFTPEIAYLFVERWGIEKLQSQIAFLQKLHDKRKGEQAQFIHKRIEQISKYEQRINTL